MIFRSLIAFVIILGAFISSLGGRILSSLELHRKDSGREILTPTVLPGTLFHASSTPKADSSLAEKKLKPKDLTKNPSQGESKLISPKNIPKVGPAPASDSSSINLPRLEEILSQLAQLSREIPPPEILSSGDIYGLLDTAVVQIICQLGPNLFVSGSGVIVSDQGIILTNAHVVKDAMDCVFRAENPAASEGKVKVVYVGDTENKISGTNIPKEDFAFLKITDLTDRSPLKRPFKFLKLNAHFAPQIGDGFYLAAYASELIGKGGIMSGTQNLVFTTASALDLFATDDAAKVPEVIELSGNISTQEGSSGSPIISPRDGSVVALVFGQDKGDDATVDTSKRKEFAFLVSYIDSVIRREKGKSLQDFVSELGTLSN